VGIESPDDNQERTDAVREQLREHPEEGAEEPSRPAGQREDSRDLERETDAAQDRLRERRERDAER